MREDNSEKKPVSDKIKDMTNGMEAFDLLQIFCDLSAEVIATISLATAIPIDTCVEEFKNEVLSTSKMVINDLKKEVH